MISIRVFSIWAFVFFYSIFTYADFPIHPEDELTPGELCSNPDEYRYPEKIAYCKRNVKKETKEQIFIEYTKDYEFDYKGEKRKDYKIDHYIPLCMGGNNETSNLWPQHKTVYEITDPLEFELCEKMKDGQLTQSKAVEMIKFGKNNLEEVPKLRDELK